MSVAQQIGVLWNELQGAHDSNEVAIITADWKQISSNCAEMQRLIRAINVLNNQTSNEQEPK